MHSCVAHLKRAMLSFYIIIKNNCYHIFNEEMRKNEENSMCV